MPQAIHISPIDNVVVALHPIAKGTLVEVDGLSVTALEDIPQGHKMAVKPIKNGEYGGIMIHSSAVEVDGKAYLFSAPCGTGKSTHTKQWQKYFGADQAIIINDDKPVLRRLEDGWYAYGTPFSGKTDENVNKKVKLQGICMLERGENRIRQIQPAEAIPLILQQTIRPKNEKYLGKMMEIMDQLLREVPVYRMQCDISEEAVKMSYEAMKG